MNVLAFSIDVTIVEIKADFDPFGSEYTQVSFAIKLAIPMPPQSQQFPPKPKPTAYKHLMHLFIPKDKWTDQFQMWKDYHLIVKDDGTTELKNKGI